MQTQRTIQQSLLARAKNGDSEALTKLMGPPLKAKGIQVAVDRKRSLLFISLVGQQCPPKRASLSFLKQGMEKLGLSGIDSVRVSGYKAGDYQPLWVERMVLGKDTPEYSDSLYKPQTKKLAAGQATAKSGTHAAQTTKRTRQTKGGELKKSFFILGGLLLALLVLGLLVRALTGPTFLQENEPPSILPTSEPVEGTV